MNQTESNQPIVIGLATIPYDVRSKVWRLPAGGATNKKLTAINVAKRIDRILSGRAKNDGGV